MPGTLDGISDRPECRCQGHCAFVGDTLPYFDSEWQADVVADEFETRVAEPLEQVPLVAREAVVNGNNFIVGILHESVGLSNDVEWVPVPRSSTRTMAIHQMRPDEPARAGNQDSVCGTHRVAHVLDDLIVVGGDDHRNFSDD